MPRPRTFRKLVTALALVVPMVVGSTSQAAPPKLPPSPNEAPRIAEPPASDPVPAPAPTSTSPAPAPAPAPAIVVAPASGSTCPSDDSLSLTGTNLWEGLSHKSLTLSLKGGDELRGSVVEQSSDQLAFARASDGTLVSVAKADVTGVRLNAASLGVKPRTPGLSEDGRGSRAGGVAMMTIGSIAGLAGVVMLGLCPPCLAIHLPLLLPGAAMIGGGVALFKAGKRKKAEYERSWGFAARARIAPSFAVHREGGYAGMILRF